MPQNEYDGNRQVKKGEIRRMRRVDYAVSPKQRKASNFVESRGQVWIEIKKRLRFYATVSFSYVHNRICGDKANYKVGSPARPFLISSSVGI